MQTVFRLGSGLKRKRSCACAHNIMMWSKVLYYFEVAVGINWKD